MVNEKPVTRPSTVTKHLLLWDYVQYYVNNHLYEHITLPMVASNCYASVSSITQLFQQMNGTTFHVYVKQRRMEKAKELIQEGVPLEAVGKQVGYNDHSSFYRAFRQTFGISPREYRNQIRGSES